MPNVVRQKAKPKRLNKGTPLTKSKGIVSRITNLDDLPNEGLRMCIYGKSGTGKTRLMSTFASEGPLLHMICSSNGVNEARSIRGVDNIEIVEIEKPEDIPDLIDYIQERKYTTVALDHVTGFCDCVLASILGISKLPEQLSFGATKRDHYQQLGLQVKTYLRQIMDLDCNVILIGQERAFGSGGEEDDILMPYVSVAATPSIAGWIAPAVDYLCQTFKREGTRKVTRKVGKKEVEKEVKTGKVDYCLRVGPDETYMTKFRVPPGTQLPDVIVNPSYEKLSELVNI